ncbi:MAG: hypothetical protein AMXMBFR7_05160 [Planctomycetota bacterium]|nr:sigma-70 family RNA polymerase sigma factor [Planctomycetota bacterium]
MARDDTPEPGMGDLRHFDQWVQEHQQSVYTYILRMIGNAQDAEDLTQDALMQTYRTKARVAPESGGYLKWCFRISRNLVIDYRRKKRPRGAEEEELERAVDARSLRPEEVYEHRVKGGELREELLALPEKYREALLLRYQVDLSYEEIAQVMDVPVTTVETRIHRAKKMLRERLSRRS